LGHLLVHELTALLTGDDEGGQSAQARRLGAVALLVGVAPEACSDDVVRRVHAVDGGGASNMACVLRLRLAGWAEGGEEEVERGLGAVERLLTGGSGAVRVATLELLALGGAVQLHLVERIAPLLPRLLRRSPEHADALALLLLVGDDTEARLAHVAKFLAVAPRTAEAVVWSAGGSVSNPWQTAVLRSSFYLISRLAARLPEPDGQLSLGLDEAPPDPRRIRRLVGAGPRFSADELLRRFDGHPFGAATLPTRSISPHPSDEAVS
jgi:hypothetical protein